MSKRIICAITGTRADFGLLQPVMEKIRDHSGFSLQVAVTGMHLSPEFGLTWKSIEKAGFSIDEKVEMLLSSDTGAGIAKSVGLGVIGFADVFERLRPDMIVLLGDRFEILAAAQAALFAKIPMAHICGGDVTEGAYDESMRHAITKMANLHFVTNSEAEKRVIRLGEQPDRVFNVGSPGIDHLKSVQLMSRDELEADIGFKFHKNNILVTYHPETLGDRTPAEDFQELLDALDDLGPEVGIIATRPNADGDGRVLIRMLETFAQSRGNVIETASLGQLRYYSVMAQVDAVVGNSSSGLYEAPSFKVPTVNIGRRQDGRLRAASVLDCASDREAIRQEVKKAFALDCSDIVNPYGDGKASQRIVEVLAGCAEFQNLIRKGFYDDPTANKNSKVTSW